MGRFFENVVVSVTFLGTEDKSACSDGVEKGYHVSGDTGSNFLTYRTSACRFSLPENYFYI